MPVFTVLLALGLPLVLVFAWAFELTPEGIRRETDSSEPVSATPTGSRRLDFAIIGLLVIAVVFLLADNYVIDDESPDAGPGSEVAVRSIAVLPFKNRSALDVATIIEGGVQRDDSTSTLTANNFFPAIDEGWRFQWWQYLKHDLVLQPLHEEPAFQEMVRELEMEMAAQLENVRAMEASGELAPIPEYILSITLCF